MCFDNNDFLYFSCLLLRIHIEMSTTIMKTETSYISQHEAPKEIGIPRYLKTSIHTQLETPRP